MVASLEEALWFKGEVTRGQNALRAQGVAFNSKMPVGIMIEVPSVAFQLKRLCAELDFFSVGTNDLSQYFYAADRENAKLLGISNVRGPAFLALLKNIVSEIRSSGKWVGLCGEMGGDPRNLPLLAGIGFDEISASGNVIPALKRATARLNGVTCRELIERAIQCGTAAEVEALLQAAVPAAVAEPLFSTSLVALDSDSQNKDEAIRELVDTLHAAGRIEDRRRMEEAVWAREAVYSTGLGHGFAIPHCKTDLVHADSIGILKLKQPIEWGSLDGAPVSMVILLALSDSNPKGSHMKVFSRLARKLMNEEFRGRLMEINDPGELISHVGRELEDSI
jgi:fructose-specific PTS system IIA-like component